MSGEKENSEDLSSAQEEPVILDSSRVGDRGHCLPRRL